MSYVPLIGLFPGKMQLRFHVSPESFETNTGAMSGPQKFWPGINAEAAISFGFAGLTARFVSLSWCDSPLNRSEIMFTTLTTVIDVFDSCADPGVPVAIVANITTIIMVRVTDSLDRKERLLSSRGPKRWGECLARALFSCPGQAFDGLPLLYRLIVERIQRHIGPRRWTPFVAMEYPDAHLPYLKFRRTGPRGVAAGGEA